MDAPNIKLLKCPWDKDYLKLVWGSFWILSGTRQSRMEGLQADCGRCQQKSEEITDDLERRKCVNLNPFNECQGWPYTSISLHENSQYILWLDELCSKRTSELCLLLIFDFGTHGLYQTKTYTVRNLRSFFHPAPLYFIITAVKTKPSAMSFCQISMKASGHFPTDVAGGGGSFLQRPI